MNIEQMTEQLQTIIMNALTKCQENHNSELAPEHILVAMLEDSGLDGIWERLKLNKQELLEFVRGYLERLTTTSSADQPMLSRYVSEGYSHALDEMKKQGDSYMSSAALLIGLLKTNADVCQNLLKKFSIRTAQVEAAEKDRRGGMKMEDQRRMKDSSTP
jgi:ATP-dependent Clp protease ATP-binding subunit ClpB